MNLVAPPLWRRMSAWTYEGVLLFGVVFLFGYLFSSLTQARHALAHVVGLRIFLFIVLSIYFVWFWSKGQTLAMKTWGIRIVAIDGKPISQQHAFWRYVLSWVWFLPPLALIASLPWPIRSTLWIFPSWIALWALLSYLQPQRQFWHDQWAKTCLTNA